MQAELNNLLWLARRKVSFESAMTEVCHFLNDNPNYALNQNNVILIIEIFRLISQNKIKNEKSFINAFLDKISTKLKIFFKTEDQEENYFEIIEISMNSTEEVFHKFSISLILLVMENPQKYKNFLKFIDDTFCENILNLHATECKQLQLLFKKIAFNNIDFCLNFVRKSLHDFNKLKLIRLLIQSLSDHLIETFIQSLDDPKYSNIYVFILNELSEQLRKTAMDFIVANFDSIDLNIFAKKLSQDSISMKLFIENENVPINFFINTLLKVTNNFNCFSFFNFHTILASNNENSESILQLFYLILSRQRKNIPIELAIDLFDRFENNDDLFRFFRLLISDNLFLYITKEDEICSQFIQKLTNNLLNCCTIASIDLYAAFTMLHDGEPLKNYIKQLFDCFLNSNESSEEFITNSLLQIFFQNQKTLIKSIEIMHEYYNKIFPNDQINDYTKFSKFTYFLEKYFSKSESVYPITDFGMNPHNKSSIEGKTEISIGPHKFLYNKTDTNDSILKRVSFVTGLDLKVLPQFSNLKQPSMLKKHLGNINFSTNTNSLPPPAYFANKTKLSSILLLNFANPKVNESTSKQIMSILELMPDDSSFLMLMKDKSIRVFTKKFFVRYLVLFDNTEMGMPIINNFISYFCELDINDNDLKMDILTSMKKNLKMIASAKEIDYNQLFDSFFDMLHKPNDLKPAYNSFLQHIIDNASNQLKNYFNKKRNLTVVDPPPFLFNNLLRLFKLVNLDEMKFIKPNKKKDFGTFIVKDMIPQIKFNMKDFRKAFELLRLRNPIDSNFIINICHQLIESNTYEDIIKKLTYKQQNKAFENDMKRLLKSLPYNPNESVRTNVLNVLSHYSKNEKFKTIIFSVIVNFMKCIKSTNFYYEPYDFSFDMKNYEKSPLGIRLKASPTNSPLNAVIQNLLNIDVFIDLDEHFSSLFAKKIDYKKYYEPSSFPSLKKYDQFTNPIEILKEIDENHLIQFENEFPNLTKPIMIIENITLLDDIQKDIVKCNRTFKFKGLIATDANKFIAIVYKNDKLIKFLDCLNEEIQSIPKPSKTFQINCVFYCEPKEIQTTNDSETTITNNRKNKRIIFCFNSDFRNFINNLSNADLSFIYYIYFAIKIKDINTSNTYAKSFQRLEIPDNFYKTFIEYLPQICNNIINIEDSSIVDNFIKVITHNFLSKIPDNRIIEVSRSILNFVKPDEFIEGNPDKIAKILSIFTEFLNIKKDYFVSLNEDNVILKLLNDVCLKCLSAEDECDFYSILDIRSIFQCLNFFISSIYKQKKPTTFFATFTCLILLDEKHYSIIKNKINIGQYICLVQKVFGNDIEYMNNFYIKLFLDGKNSEENLNLKDDYFLLNLYEVPEQMVQLLANFYFNQHQVDDPTFLFNELEEFIKKNISFSRKIMKLLPFISSYFDRFAFKFIPYLDRMIISLSKEVDLLKNLLNQIEKEMKEHDISIIDFNSYINLLKVLNYQNKLNTIVEIMKNEDKKENDSFCLFFGDFLLSCKADVIQPSYIFDIILFKMNDIRVDFALFFLKKLGGSLPKSFFLDPKLRDLYLFCMVHNQVNPLAIDDDLVSLYNLFSDIRNQTSKKLILNNPPSDRFITIMKIVKAKISSKNIQIKTLDRPPFNFIENSGQFVNQFAFSETISSLFNYLTDQKTIDIDSKIVNALIENILSNDSVLDLELNIVDQNKLFGLILKQEINAAFKSHLLDLMIFSQIRDPNAFNQLNIDISELFELDEKMFYFLSVKTLFGNDHSLFPFMKQNIDSFSDFVIKILNEPVLVNKTDQPQLIQIILDELRQNNFAYYNNYFGLERVKCILDNYLSNQ